MKKIYLGALAAAFAVTSVGAQQNLSEGPFIKKFPGDININNAQSKALGVSVWSNDFSTPTDWTVDNDLQTGASYGWSIDGTIDASWWYSAAPNFTGGGNFAELGNGDYNTSNQATMVEYTMTTATPIDVASTAVGSNPFLISFEQTGARFNDLQEVQISTDGSNYTTIYDCLGQEVFVGNNPTAEYDNVETVNILVQPTDIAANPANVTIRFRWTSNFPTDTDVVAWTTFGWYVDNVSINTLPDNDISYTNTYWGTAQLPYYAIPNAQIAPIDFSVNVDNNGSAAQTNVVFNLDVNGGASTLNSPSTTLNVSSSDSLFVTFTPTADATYDFVRTVTANEVDDIPANNVFATIPTVTVGGDVYQRDAGGTFGTGGGTSTINGTVETVFEAGTYYDIVTAEDVIALDLGIGSTAANEGKEVYGILYSLDVNGDFLFEAQTDNYVIVASDLNSVVTLNFSSAVPTTAGTTYFAAIGCADAVRYATSGTSAQGLSLIFYGGMANPVTDGNFYTTNTPVVRLNFAGTVGLEEANSNVSLGQNVPNPAMLNTKVSYTLANNAEVTFTVTNLAGQVIETMDLGSVNAGTQSINLNTANYAAGVYNYTISVDGSATTKRMIIQK